MFLLYINHFLIDVMLPPQSSESYKNSNPGKSELSKRPQTSNLNVPIKMPSLRVLNSFHTGLTIWPFRCQILPNASLTDSLRIPYNHWFLGFELHCNATSSLIGKCSLKFYRQDSLKSYMETPHMRNAGFLPIDSSQNHPWNAVPLFPSAWQNAMNPLHNMSSDRSPPK